MPDTVSPSVLGILLIGLVAVLAAPMRAVLGRLGLPDVVGYILLGLALGAVDWRFLILTGETRHGLDMLAAAGVVLLLFRAGLESHPAKLMRQLPRASLALLGNVAASAGLGYVACVWLLGTGTIPAVFVAIALSATSVGVSLAVWREAGALASEQGALLLDLAELDDVAAVFLLAVVLALAPVLNGNADGETLPQLLVAAGWLAVKLTVFGAACLAFATWPLTRWFARLDNDPVPIVPVAGIAFVIAAISDWLGFSLAIGALAAGLAFSRDPERVRLDAGFDVVSRLFVPFFFVGIGLDVAVDALPGALPVGALLLAAAVVGKIAGTALPLACGVGGAGALLIGVSMVPRAEIAMIVMDRGRALGDWAVPPGIYGGMVVVTLGSCLLAPPLVALLLRRRPPPG